MRKGKLLLVMSMLTLLVVGCGIKKMVKKYPDVAIKLENPDLENKGGKVEYTVKGTVPPKYMKKKADVTIEVPVLSYDQATGKETKNYGTLTLVGEKSKKSGTVIPYKTGGNFTKTGSFDYNESLENADIQAIATISKGKKTQTMPVRHLGEGISNTSSLVGLVPEVKETDENGKITGNGSFLLYAPHQYKPEFITKTGVIYFEVNMSNLNWNLKLNKDQTAKDNIKALVDFIAENRKVDKIIVTGWASPEGEESKNQGLSEKRFEQGKKWFEQEYDKYLKDYAKKNKIKLKDLVKPTFVFENHANGEDWGGFETAVEKSKIAEKNQILNVVRSQSNNNLREQKIREMTDIYNEIKEAILPPLRRSEVSMVCNKNTFNEQQIMALALTHPDTLSVNEKLYAASKDENLQHKENIYTNIINTTGSQNEWRAYNNLAVLQLSEVLRGNMSEYEQAVSNLNKAAAISPRNGIVLNNIAIATVLSGDVKGAKSKFEEASKATVYPIAQDYNLGMYKILDGDYNAAKNLMNGKHCDYNMALAQLVNKEYSAAKTTLDCIPDQDAKVLYLKAILSARTGNEAEVMSNLRQTVDKDSKYKHKAKRNPEFKKYRKSAEFENIVK
ncbi:MAG: hypothetical protein LBR51_01860 [Bacteroidales bacterium]|jgi:outer membrane protein OmpA-like peptidoglycan-associated protein|nr:hypothetical protein [Bacteroidales bacterium]